ncbi:MAG: hypothetical protein ABIU09_03455 [Pyrinomonadaceae bacterium]
MRVKILFLLCLSILAVVPATAQTKSVTNADLEKFRQKRLQSEKDYRENYARLGFPSPEELDRQIEKSRVERDALSARLTAERLQREQIEAARAEAVRNSDWGVYFVQDNSTRPSGYYYPNAIYYGRRFPRVKQNFWVRVGNGIPIVNYGYPPVRSVRPSFRWLRP